MQSGTCPWLIAATEYEVCASSGNVNNNDIIILIQVKLVQQYGFAAINQGPVYLKELNPDILQINNFKRYQVQRKS